MLSSRAALLAIAAVAIGCGRLGFDETASEIDATVSADAARLPLNFSDGDLVTELMSDGQQSDDAFLTADQLEIFFASNRPGGVGPVDIYTAGRASDAAVFSNIRSVPNINDSGPKSTVVVSGNGLWLLYGSQTEDPEQDVYIASRADRTMDFGAPTRLTSVNSAQNDSASWISDDGLTIFVHSNRSGEFDAYVATRASTDTPFGAAQPIPGLMDAGNELSASLYPGFALLSFRAEGGDDYDLFVAPRIGDTIAFGAKVPLVGPNTAQHETDPWLSPDGCTLYFSREVAGGGNPQIYRATCSP